MILAAHQPDLLPYTGFWAKMAAADMFAVLKDVDINHDGYTRRVRMRGTWVSLLLEERHASQRIRDCTLQVEAASKLWAGIEGRYRGSKYWTQRAEMVNAWVLDAVKSLSLWQFNLSLILSVRDWLEIPTPIVVPPLSARHSVGRLVELCAVTGADVYLAGLGSQSYLTENAWSLAAGEDAPKLRWSEHEPWTGDSILTTIFDKADPMEWVWAKEITKLHGDDRVVDIRPM